MAKGKRAHHTRQFSGFVIGICLLLVVAHGFFSGHVRIDNTTVLLLVVILLVPYLPWITRIKFGDFEAEIGREEIREIEQKLDAAPTQPSEASSKDRALGPLQELAESDPAVALLRIRIAIEERLRKLMAIYIPARPIDKRYLSIITMVFKLREAGALDPQLAGALKDVVSVANRAVHGESISRVNLETIINLSVRVIRSLDTLLADKALKTVRARRTSTAQVQKKLDAQYEVKTIATNASEPEERTYIFSQAEFDAFLENYDDDTEFIISVKEIKTE